jgi:ribose transport system substrate-binding protein
MSRRQKSSPRLSALPALAALGLVLGLAISACGGGSSSTSSGSATSGGEGSSGSSEVATSKAELAKLYKGEYGKPNPEAPAHKSGMNVWAISVGYEAQGSKIGVEEFKKGAEELGWNATLRDGKFSPTEELTAVREAVQANADAIWLEAIDCEPIKAGLEEAKQAGIVVIASNATDCSEPLYTASTELESGPYPDYLTRFGEAQAVWAIADSNAEAKVLLVYENDIAGTKIINEGAKKRFEQCETCEIVGEVTFVGTELGPPLQQKVEQALLKYPTTTVVNGNYDTAAELGVVPAVRSSGKQISVLGAEGLPSNLELLKNGEQAMDVGYSFGWVAYSALDDMVRLLAGEKEVSKSGADLQVIDAENNLPAGKGEPFEPPVDYKALYREAWGVE